MCFTHKQKPNVWNLSFLFPQSAQYQNAQTEIMEFCFTYRTLFHYRFITKLIFSIDKQIFVHWKSISTHFESKKPFGKLPLSFECFHFAFVFVISIKYKNYICCLNHIFIGIYFSIVISFFFYIDPDKNIMNVYVRMESNVCCMKMI